MRRYVADPRRERERIYQRAYYRRNKERMKAARAERGRIRAIKVRTNPEELAKYKAYMAHTLLKRNLGAIRRRCLKSGVPFNLTEADVVVPSVCPVFGFPLVVGIGGTKDNVASIDRIVPERGYVSGNIVVVSQLANRMKNSGTIDQLVKLAKFYTALTGYSHT